MPGGVPTPKQIKAAAPTRKTSVYSPAPNAPKGSFDNPIKQPQEPADYAKIVAAEERQDAAPPNVIERD
jgi:hypothetical protein